MSRRFLVAMLICAAVSVACSDTPTASEGGVAFILVTGPVSSGAIAKARLVNNSEARIEVGAIGCEITTDRQEAGGWTEVPRGDGVCPLPAILIPSGRSYSFEFAAPATAGTFRLRTSSGATTILSPPFLVK
ncbi:MAG: hypothetical protein V4558_15975 [Gemmatimonadota bacterium]